MKITKEQYDHIFSRIIEDFSKEMDKRYEVNEEFDLSKYLEITVPKVEMIKVPGDHIQITDHHDNRYRYSLYKHPLITAQFYKIDDLELKYTINKATAAFAELLKDKNPKYFRFLPLPHSYFNNKSAHCLINNLPCRAILGYNAEFSSYVLTLDTITVD